MSRLFDELKRRRVIRIAALYIVAAWVVIQVLGEAFDAWGIPDEALRYVWIAAVLGFPVALAFAWRFDVVGGRIVVTHAAEKGAVATKLGRLDYALLGALALVLLAIVLGAIQQATQRSAVPDAGMDPQSVAVLPFDNLSGDDANASFTAGVHDDILTHIARVSELKVISRTSVARLDPTLSIAEVGALLGVRAVLEGGVQRSGDRLRVNVQLIDAASDTHMWADTFDVELDTRNVFDLQSDIARAVARALQATLSPGEQRRLDARPTDSFEAYEAYLLGNHELGLRSGPSLTAAAGHFRRAIRLDPDYALAHVGLANALLLLSNYGHLALSDALQESGPLLARALELDDNLAAAHAVEGLRYLRQGLHEQGRVSLRRAIALDPNHAPAWHWLADSLLHSGEPLGESLAAIERARELDPLSPIIIVTHAEILDALGRFDEALATNQHALTIEPDFAGAYFLIGLLEHYAFGRVDEGVRWKLAEARTSPERPRVGLGFSWLDLGDADAAREALEFSLARQPDQYWPLVGITRLHLYLEDEERTLDFARRLHARFPLDNVYLYALVYFGHDDEVLAAVRDALPDLDCDAVQLDRRNVFQAINVSLALERSGEQACADRLLDAALVVIRDLPRLGTFGHGIADVEIYARQGKTELALATLREAIDAGWRGNWWLQGERSPHNAAITGEPRFKAMMDEVRADMAAQRENVRRWEASGELYELE